MHDADDEVVKTASAAYFDAWNDLGPDRTISGISERELALALAIGIAATLTRGERSHFQLRRDALDQVAIAVFERKTQHIYPRPYQLTGRYAACAEKLRAMAGHVADERCRAALIRCGDDFDAIADATRWIKSAAPAWRKAS